MNRSDTRNMLGFDHRCARKMADVTRMRSKHRVSFIVVPIVVDISFGRLALVVFLMDSSVSDDIFATKLRRLTAELFKAFIGFVSSDSYYFIYPIMDTTFRMVLITISC